MSRKKGSGKAAAGKAKAARRRRRSRWILPVVALAAAVAFGVVWILEGGGRASGFDVLVAAGQPRLERVRSEPDRGRDHVPAGTEVATGEPFPLSGPHWPRPLNPGFYDEPQPAGLLIHSLEHGHIVIYYDAIDQGALETLRRWTQDFDGPWSGVIAVPREGLGDDLVLTAWRHRLDLPRFHAPAAAAFIDAYRGRGPENPVR